MSIVFSMIILSIVLIFIGAVCFVWAVKNNQFEDLDREAYNILFEKDKNDRDNPS